MGCGASSLDKVIAKQNGQLPLIIHSREKEEPADDTDTHNPEYSNRETSARSKLKSKKYTVEVDPVLKTFQDILPSLQQRRSEVDLTKELPNEDLPGTPTTTTPRSASPDRPSSFPPTIQSESPMKRSTSVASSGYRMLDEEEEDIEDPQELEAVRAAKIVIAEVKKQIRSGRQIAASPLIRSENRERAEKATLELEELIPFIMSTTRLAFHDNDSQAKLKDIIGRIAELNAELEECVKPDKEILVLPKAKHVDELLKTELGDMNMNMNMNMNMDFTHSSNNNEVASYNLSNDFMIRPQDPLPQRIVKTSTVGESDRNRARRMREGTRKRAGSTQNLDTYNQEDLESKPWLKDKFKLVEKTKNFANGDRYTGQFNVKGLQHGYGRYEFANGDVYEGEFKNGKFCGKGKITMANGDWYEGDFLNDVYHGTGTFVDAETGDKYTGSFQHGERSGIGVYSYGSGDKYEGSFERGERHGQGTWTSFDGRVMYSGSYVHGKRQGQGRLVSNGNEYIGDFLDGKMHGRGTLIYSNGNKWTGEFRNGEIDGRGEFVFANGTKYEGVVSPDGSFAYGVMTYPTGDVYTGQFLNRRPHGKGQIIHANGDMYEGLWNDGKKHGQGKLVKANGDVLIGSFVNGKYMTPPSWGRVDTSKREEEERQRQEELRRKNMERINELKQTPTSVFYSPKQGW